MYKTNVQWLRHLAMMYACHKHTTDIRSTHRHRRKLRGTRGNKARFSGYVSIGVDPWCWGLQKVNTL